MGQSQGFFPTKLRYTVVGCGGAQISKMSTPNLEESGKKFAKEAASVCQKLNTII